MDAGLTTTPQSELLPRRSSRTRESSNRSRASMVGVGMRPGVSLMNMVSRCMKRPTRLQTSLRMLDDGYDYERCCEQLLLGGGGGTRSLGDPNISSGGREGTTAANTFSEGIMSESVRSDSQSTAILRPDDVLVTDMNGDGDEGKIPFTVEGGERNDDDDAAQEVFGKRLLTKARKFASQHNPTLNLSSSSSPPLSSTSALPPHPCTASSSPYSLPNNIVLNGRDKDDDCATQWFHRDYTIQDLLNQEAMMHKEEEMIRALEHRFSNDEEGMRLLQANLWTAKRLATPQSGNGNTMTVGSSPPPSLTSIMRVTPLDASVASLSLSSPSKLWKEQSPSRLCLPPLHHKTTVNSGEGSLAHAASVPRSPTKEKEEDGPLLSSIRLAPMASPVSLKRLDSANGNASNLDGESFSAVRRRIDQQVAHARAAIREAAKIPHVRRCTQEGALPQREHDASVMFEKKHHLYGESDHGPSLPFKVFVDRAVVDLLSCTQEVEDGNTAKDSLIWNFEVEACLNEVATSLSHYYTS